MSDHKELCAALRRVSGIGWRGNEAADLIEAQAARIAELEAAGVMTAVMLTIDGREYGVHPNVAAMIKDQEVSIGQAVEFAQYAEDKAKGAMVDAAKRFLSVPFAETIRQRLEKPKAKRQAKRSKRK